MGLPIPPHLNRYATDRNLINYLIVKLANTQNGQRHLQRCGKWRRFKGGALVAIGAVG